MESSLWGDDDHVGSAAEWTRMSNEFTNAGYREGITAGKDLSVQHGFNNGYAIGAALGRQSGFARGSLTAILSFLTSSRSHSLPDDVRESRTQEALALFSNFHVKDINDQSETNGLVPDQEKMEVDMLDRVAELGKTLGFPIGPPPGHHVAYN